MRQDTQSFSEGQLVLGLDFIFSNRQHRGGRVLLRFLDNIVDRVHIDLFKEGVQVRIREVVMDVIVQHDCPGESLSVGFALGKPIGQCCELHFGQSAVEVVLDEGLWVHRVGLNFLETFFNAGTQCDTNAVERQPYGVG